MYIVMYIVVIVQYIYIYIFTFGTKGTRLGIRMTQMLVSFYAIHFLFVRVNIGQHFRRSLS
jgi:hypothetical protein